MLAVCIAVRILEHDELGAREGGAHEPLVRQRLGRVRAGDPDRLHLAAGHRLEHLDGRLPGTRRQIRHAPERRDFWRAMRGVRRIACLGAAW
jgi:hypothetical protein